jgi:hypothetical protein
MTNTPSARPHPDPFNTAGKPLTTSLRAGISPKVISERIGHANVGFFLETYAHVLGNDDREAAEQAAEFLLGDAWDIDAKNGPG